MKNKYKVSKRQWKKWNDQEQELFIAIYEVSTINSWLFQHPKTPEVSPKYWNTVAWNHAWMAADLVREQRLRKET